MSLYTLKFGLIEDIRACRPSFSLSHALGPSVTLTALSNFSFGHFQGHQNVLRNECQYSGVRTFIISTKTALLAYSWFSLIFCDLLKSFKLKLDKTMSIFRNERGLMNYQLWETSYFFKDSKL